MELADESAFRWLEIEVGRAEKSLDLGVKVLPLYSMKSPMAFPLKLLFLGEYF
jgi:hypothetical protein